MYFFELTFGQKHTVAFIHNGTLCRMCAVLLYSIHLYFSWNTGHYMWKYCSVPHNLLVNVWHWFQITEENIWDKSVICYIYTIYCSLCCSFLFAFTDWLQSERHYLFVWFSHLRKDAATSAVWFCHWAALIDWYQLFILVSSVQCGGDMHISISHEHTYQSQSFFLSHSFSHLWSVHTGRQLEKTSPNRPTFGHDWNALGPTTICRYRFNRNSEKHWPRN